MLLSYLKRKYRNYKLSKCPRINLWVDDERLPPDDYMWAITAAEAINIIKSFPIDTLSLDHDLGPPSAGTGYDVACWIENNIAHIPKIIDCHSANPVGRKRIEMAINSAYKREGEF